MALVAWLWTGGTFGHEVRLVVRREVIVGVDIQPYRLDAANAANAETINAAEIDPVQAIRALTNGRGTDVCVDVVGMATKRNLLDKLSNLVHTSWQHQAHKKPSAPFGDHISSSTTSERTFAKSRILRHKNVRTNVPLYSRRLRTDQPNSGGSARLWSEGDQVIDGFPGHRLHPFYPIRPAI